ncbi:MAG: substrate-binding domain-containing protein, partial [Acidimicrobiales bacterium]
MKKGKLFGNRGWHHRSASAAAALTAAALAVAALGTTTTAASAAPAKYNFVLIPGTVTDPFYITMGIGAKAEAAKLGISLTFKGTTTWNPTQQVPIVNATLATHPSALLIAPSDDVALFKPIDAYV